MEGGPTIPISSVGLITSGVQANEILDSHQADIVRPTPSSLSISLADVVHRGVDHGREGVPAQPQLGAGLGE